MMRNISTEAKLFFWTLAFLASLYGIPNNKILMAATSVFITGLFFLWRDVSKALLYGYLVLLPITVGKGAEFLLIPAEYIRRAGIHGLSGSYFMTVNITMANVLCGFLVYGYVRSRNGNGGKKPSIADIFFAIYLVSNIISSILSDIPWLSLMLTIQTWSYAFVYFFIRQHRLKIWLISVLPFFLAALGIFEGGWSGMQFFRHALLGRYIENVSSAAYAETLVQSASEDASFLRYQGTFNHPNDLGMVMAYILPFLLYFSVSKEGSKFRKLISAIGLLGASSALLVSGSRAPWITAGIVGIWFARHRIIQNAIYVTPKAKIIIRLIIYGVILLLPPIILPRLAQLGKTFSPEGGANFRLDLIEKSLAVAREHPFGIGMGTFPQTLFLDIGGFTSFPTQPHNLAAQILVANGFMGVFSFFAFMYFTVRPAFHAPQTMWGRQNGAVRLIGLASAGAFLFLSMFYPVLTEQSVFAMFWIFLAIVA